MFLLCDMLLCHWIRVGKDPWIVQKHWIPRKATIVSPYRLKVSLMVVTGIVTVTALSYSLQSCMSHVPVMFFELWNLKKVSKPKLWDFSGFLFSWTLDRPLSARLPSTSGNDIAWNSSQYPTVCFCLIIFIGRFVYRDISLCWIPAFKQFNALFISRYFAVLMCGLVAPWLRHLTYNRRSLVQSQPLHCQVWQVVHTHLPLTKQYNLVRA